MPQPGYWTNNIAESLHSENPEAWYPSVDVTYGHGQIPKVDGFYPGENTHPRKLQDVNGRKPRRGKIIYGVKYGTELFG